MAVVKKHNIKNINLIVGSRSIEAFVFDSEINIDKAEDDVSQTDGLDGSMTHNENPSNKYTSEFSVMPNSEDHTFLRGLRASKTQFPVLYDNENTGERASLTGCRFVKPAPKVDGREIGNRVWNIVGSGQELT